MENQIEILLNNLDQITGLAIYQCRWLLLSVSPLPFVQESDQAFVFRVKYNGFKSLYCVICFSLVNRLGIIPCNLLYFFFLRCPYLSSRSAKIGIKLNLLTHVHRLNPYRHEVLAFCSISNIRFTSYSFASSAVCWLSTAQQQWFRHHDLLLKQRTTRI